MWSVAGYSFSDLLADAQENQTLVLIGAVAGMSGRSMVQAALLGAVCGASYDGVLRLANKREWGANGMARSAQIAAAAAVAMPNIVIPAVRTAVSIPIAIASPLVEGIPI
jgi:hypothetical protein